MPYVIEKRGEQWCVKSTDSGKTHGCHDTRADAIKQQRALYKNAPPAEEAARAAEILTAVVEAGKDGLVVLEASEESLDEITLVNVPSEETVTMTAVEKRIPVKDIALLRMAVQRSGAQSEQEVEHAVNIAAGLADPEVAAQTVAVIGHLADRLKTAELNQAALVEVLQSVATDSTSSRNALLEALSGITERLAEAPPINITVPPAPPPDVFVNVEQAGKRVVELERDSQGRLVGATTGTRTIELERDSTGKLVGATVEEEGADSTQEAA